MYKLFKKRTYLDFASITPVSKEVSREMKKGEFLFANPSSLYKEGVLARKKIEEAFKVEERLFEAFIGGVNRESFRLSA